jgi:hypothetical protein
VIVEVVVVVVVVGAPIVVVLVKTVVVNWREAVFVVVKLVDVPDVVVVGVVVVVVVVVVVGVVVVVVSVVVVLSVVVSLMVCVDVLVSTSVEVNMVVVVVVENLVTGTVDVTVVVVFAVTSSGTVVVWVTVPEAVTVVVEPTVTTAVVVVVPVVVVTVTTWPNGAAPADGVYPVRYRKPQTTGSVTASHRHTRPRSVIVSDLLLYPGCAPDRRCPSNRPVSESPNCCRHFKCTQTRKSIGQADKLSQLYFMYLSSSWRNDGTCEEQPASGRGLVSLLPLARSEPRCKESPPR